MPGAEGYCKPLVGCNLPPVLAAMPAMPACCPICPICWPICPIGCCPICWPMGRKGFTGGDCMELKLACAFATRPMSMGGSGGAPPIDEPDKWPIAERPCC